MWNFRKVISTGDTRYLYILNSYYDLPETYPYYEKFNDLFWDYMDAKGLDSKFKLRLELKAKLAILESEEVCDGKKNGVKIMLTKQKLEDLKEKGKKSSDLENDMILSKFMGGNLINPKTTTVSQYIGMEKLLEESNKEITKQSNKANGKVNR